VIALAVPASAVLLLEFDGAAVAGTGDAIVLPLFDAGPLCAEIFEEETTIDAKRSVGTTDKKPTRMEVLH
jgi:hypothetical protein